MLQLQMSPSMTRRMERLPSQDSTRARLATQDSTQARLATQDSARELNPVDHTAPQGGVRHTIKFWKLVEVRRGIEKKTSCAC